ncbi:UDP-N-acetylmuramoyl-L-alanine--D-glutamate ligase [Nocardioides sp.]|uniref:UDP-N-acetylmuramoyl-L-alanine--D-glutamate ligase n=1 Tax=Nocardioides sp. TaxID=35761 RepID=UPI0026305F37|nr:UDP-N-acetylmuramoyl-L-alanine--D-glutamate ligase [Nocardioides sp.]
MDFSDLAGRRVVVWGYGREGRSVAAHLRDLGLGFTIAEPDRPSGENPEVLYADAGRAAVLGADVAIKSPGIPVTSALYREAAAVPGLRITSLTDLWMHENARRTIAVTGTKGKSTTASLIAHVLASAGRSVSLRGNIGTPVLEEPTPPSETVVMELSSYQAQSLTISPRILAVTVLFPEHLTWHGSEEAYYADKLNAAAHGPDAVVITGGDEGLRTRVGAAAGDVPLLATGPDSVTVDDEGGLIWADGTRVRADAMPLLGRHQARNAALAALVCAQEGLDPATIAAAITTFAPLEHRMQPVASTDGRTWIDDSLATAPEAVIATLEALPGRRVAAIIGGADRGLDFTRLTAYLAANPRVRPLLIGPVGARIAAEVGATPFATFAEATAWAHSAANPAEVVLLSPGAPSFDEFADYVARSTAFQTAAVGDGPLDTVHDKER